MAMLHLPDLFNHLVAVQAFMTLRYIRCGYIILNDEHANLCVGVNAVGLSYRPRGASRPATAC